MLSGHVSIALRVVSTNTNAWVVCCWSIILEDSLIEVEVRRSRFDPASLLQPPELCMWVFDAKTRQEHLMGTCCLHCAGKSDLGEHLQG